MSTAIDFFTAKSDATDVADSTEPKRTEPTPIPEGDDGAKAAVEDVINFLLPGAKEQDESPPVEDKKASEPKGESKPDVRQNPVVHPASLLQLAESWGIPADQAASYSTSEALLGAVAIRELRYNKAVAERDKASKGKEKEQPADDELAPPKFDFDEDDDPKVKAVAETSTAYARKIKERADKEVAALREEVEALKADQQQAAIREARNEEAKIAAMIDEKVASWGDEFTELLGVPQESWQAKGTPQHAEVAKLRDYLIERKIGYEGRTGNSPSLEVMAGFLSEARGALWPQMAQKKARSEIADKLRKQKGGVGLRSGPTGRDDKPAQGDGAAKVGISDYLTQIGLNPWAKRSA